MPTDPNEPLSVLEQRTYGAGAVRHPVTGICLEVGSGALLPKRQAYNHLQVIAKTEGQQAAAETRAKLDDYYAMHAETEPVTPRPAPPVMPPRPVVSVARRGV